jgi:hypothetical protein
MRNIGSSDVGPSIFQASIDPLFGLSQHIKRMTEQPGNLRTNRDNIVCYTQVRLGSNR